MYFRVLEYFCLCIQIVHKVQDQTTKWEFRSKMFGWFRHYWSENADFELIVLNICAWLGGKIKMCVSTRHKLQNIVMDHCVYKSHFFKKKHTLFLLLYVYTYSIYIHTYIHTYTMYVYTITTDLKTRETSMEVPLHLPKNKKEKWVKNVCKERWR